MNTTCNTPRALWLCGTHVAATVMLLTAGCQSPRLMALKGKSGTSPIHTASSSQEAGLPKPTNAEPTDRTLSPDSVAEHLRLGEQELEQGNYQQAQMHFDHVLQTHPEHVRAHHRLGVLADKLGQYPQAEQHYLTALNGDPRNATLLSDLGYSYFMQGRYPESERYLLEARKIDPDYETAVANLGLLYGNTGREQEALAMFRQIGDDAQVQSIMQQISGGSFAPRSQLAANPQAAQQTSAVLAPGSVQPQASGTPQTTSSATREFVEQMRRSAGDSMPVGQAAAWEQPVSPALATAAPQPASQIPPTWPQQAALQHTPATRPAPQYSGVTPFSPQQAQNVSQPPQQSRGIEPAQRQWSQEIAPTTHPGANSPNSSFQPGAFAGQPYQPDTTGTSFAQQNAPQAYTESASSSAGNGALSHDPHPNLTSSPQNAYVPNGHSPPAEPSGAAWAQQLATNGYPGRSPGSSQPEPPPQNSEYGDLRREPYFGESRPQQPGVRQDLSWAGQNTSANQPLGPPSLNGNFSPPPQQAFTTGSTGSQTSPDANSYEQARREAALLGLGAGPGQMFPRIDQSTAGTAYGTSGGPSAAPSGGLSSAAAPVNRPTLNGDANGNHSGAFGQSTSPVATWGDAPRDSSAAAPTLQNQQSGYQPARAPLQSAYSMSVAPAVPQNGIVDQNRGQSPTSSLSGTLPLSTARPDAAARFETQQPPPYWHGNDAATAAGSRPSYPAQPQTGGVVIPEPYRRAPRPGGDQMPVIEGRSNGETAGAAPYTAPMIVPNPR